MRTVLTVVLRLFVDTDEPEALRGALQVPGSPEPPLSFNHPGELEEKLKRLAAGEPKRLSGE